MGMTKKGWETRRANGNDIPWNKNKRGLQIAWNKGKKGLNSGSDNPFYGKTHTKEVRELISKINKGNKYHLGTTHSEEARMKMSLAHRGKPLSEIHKEKIRQSAKRGENNPNWKGDNIGYYGIHDWIEKLRGKANKCEFCGVLNPKRFEWSNISQRYRRDVSDWQQLCASCHRKYDWKKTNRVPWNKNLKKPAA